jgi:uncharacterized protein (DUF1330 family)
MAAYVLVEVEIHDPEAYERYKSMAAGALAPYGGRFIVRGGACETLEGDWRPARLVVLEFPDMERARAWWASPEYAPAKALRHASADTNLVIVDGV